ncbi:SDR family NAD(P)-dependent oxidoreductase [Streptomyces eurythermus]|uniref:SDR family NAD(P)-dependent oxidoreductase n=1 Tax=Streptomyces eurythermus TaxID=42237 RepID=UPI0036A1E39F
METGSGAGTRPRSGSGGDTRPGSGTRPGPGSGGVRQSHADAAAIAVVGMACRLPGAHTVDDFRELLRAGRNEVTRRPDGTWRAALADHAGFDADFFDMSPQQAAATDPQHRLLLELGWEALENAGIDPGRLAGTATGVFAGIASDDYATLVHRARSASGAHTATGLHRALAPNRLSYFLGLRGPSIAVDTAQSSSLVAVHLACESLRRGESTLAVVGGVHLVMADESTTAMDRMGALSPDGQCHTFDARANGYVRGEGGAALVLKPLDKAIEDGDRVHCVIKGGAVNNDGGGDSLTTPHRQAQEAMLREAYARTGTRPEDVRYVELHGTGTRAGDPVEAAALGAVLGTARAEAGLAPLAVGSVKTNVGHLEGAAGIVGLLKAALCVREGMLPPSLNYRTPHPDIPLEQLHLDVQTALEPWTEEPGKRRVAGVSSFGMGGTNAHVVLEQAPDETEVLSAPVEHPVPVVVSGASVEALDAGLGRLAGLVESDGGLGVGEVGWSSVHRSVFEHRAVVVGSGREELLEGLKAPVVSGVAGSVGRSVLVFPGQGTQWAGMGAELLESSPVFAARMGECAAALGRFVEWDLLGVVRSGEGLERVDVVQPVTWAVMVSLAEVWASAGVRPDAVVGHSQGEIAAAVVSGAVSLEDGARVVALRSQVIGRVLAGAGGMASVALPAGVVEERLSGWSDRLGVAAVNGPGITVVSGDADAVGEFLEACEQDGIRARRIPVDYASHSAQVEAIEAELAALLAPVVAREPEIPFYSTVEPGQRVRTDAGYWYRNLRSRVRFAETVGVLLADGFGVFIEASAHPVLTIGIQELADQTSTGRDVVVTGTLRKGEGGLHRLWTSMAEAFVQGVPVDWKAAYTAHGLSARRIDLPTYPFQRRQHWFDAVEEQPTAAPEATGMPDTPLSRRLAGLSAGEQEKVLLEAVQAHSAAALGRGAAGDIVVERTFKEQGFESLTNVELRNRLNTAFGLRLPSSVAYDHPTPFALARHIRAQFTGEAGTTTNRQAALPVTAAVDTEPIAIVGMACRFPGGVGSAEDLWDLVAAETDAVSGFPVDRGWDVEGLYDPDPDAVGTSYVREGGFLHEAGEFDAGFFGVSPREAVAMDPQQRLLLETSWETLERAGIDPHTLRGSQTGVYVGAMSQEYGPRLYEHAQGYEGYLLTGNTASVASGRISYVLGLEGPAVSVDTACSSSLVALHLAVQALRQGECDLALAGGVTVMASPGMFVEFSRQRGLAADGRCKAFSDAADGTGWAEGVGMLAVERLSDARRRGHRVLAVVRGSAVNQDGASNGLTAPNGPSQERVIRQALGVAGLGPADVDVVEAHGTGTRLGDPIEAQALLATYGQGRPAERPLWLGSLKSNIGHTQAAAGVAGVIKMVMALRHGVLPRTLHVEVPSSHVDWSSGAVEVLTQTRAWPVVERARRAAVSAFGVSGTNAHVVLEQAPSLEVEPEPTQPDRTVPVVVSGASATALDAGLGRLAGLMESDGGLGVGEVGWSAAHRSVFEHRAVVVASGREELLEGLKAPVVSGVAGSVGRSVLVFPGQGTQWAGMGAELLESSPVFAARMGECAAALGSLVEWDLLEVVRSGEGLERVDVVQPVTWAVMVSLAEVWAACGVRPDAVVGHSQGEIAAAVVSGAVSLEDGARVVALRSQVIGRVLAGAGGMASVALPAGVVEERLSGWSDRLGVAAVNGPAITVVSGDADAVGEFVEACEQDGIRARRIPVDYASHSAQVEAVEAELAVLLAPVVAREPEIPFYSTVEPGQRVRTDAGYWYRNLRRRVHFAETVEVLLADGFGVFIEASAHPVLTIGIQELADQAGTGRDVVVTGTLRKGEGGLHRLWTSMAEAFVQGVPVDWKAAYTAHGLTARRIDLPTYPFQRRHYWLESGTRAQASVGTVTPSGVDAWRYKVVWKGLPTQETARLSGRWLLVLPEGTDSGPADGIADTLTRCGADLARVSVPLTADRAHFAELLAAHRRQNEEPGSKGPGNREPAVQGVLSLLALSHAPSAVPASVSLVQAANDIGLGAPVWAVTQGAVAVTPGEVPDDMGARLRAFGRVASLELPEVWGGSIDLPSASPDERVLRRMAAVLGAAGTADGAEDEMAIRSAGAYGRRVVRAPGGSRTHWRPRGTVLVTGGTGALGGHVARWLAANGAEHLVLTSRRGRDAPGAVALTAELEARGARVTVVACDVSDRAALAALLDEHPPTAVFHTAGVLADGVIDGLSADGLALVSRPKADAAELLHELTADRDVDAFVLFSSVTGVWGNGGQAAYAAANAALDALAERRRADGLPATAIAWGPWAGGGMAEGTGEESLVRRGIETMDPAQAVEALQQALDRDDTCVTVTAVDWERFAPSTDAVRATRLFSTVPEAREALDTARRQRPTAPGAAELTALLNGRTEAERRHRLVELIRDEAAAVLRHGTTDAIGPDRAFKEVGFDSLTALELRNRVNAATGLSLPTTTAFDYPNPAALADHILSRLTDDEGTERAGHLPGTFKAATDDDLIAIVGMACRFPGDVDSPETLWDLVLRERDVIGDPPTDRGWDFDAIYSPEPGTPGKTYAREGGFLLGAGEFDAGFFGVSPREAVAMDPQQRLLLETSWEVLERAGIDPRALRGSRTGVYTGLTHQEYAARLHEASQDHEGYLLTGKSASVASGRISYVLGLEGPAVSVDTACSSSLVALHLAVRALRQGECDLALAGGVTVMAAPGLFVEFSRQRGLAADGRCKAFSDAADGTGWAEGVGMLAVERLSDARRRGHRVLAVVRGSAVNQDGASNGLTAPNGPSQERVIAQALADARLTAGDVDVVEAHGTGTRLGDPIEAQALLATYGQGRPAERPLWLGSLKSNIGHTQAAAGVAGVIKMVMALRHGVLPRTLHVEVPSSHVDWSSGGVEVLTQTRAWPVVERARRAAVSAFGVSGTNAHVVLEQAPDERDVLSEPVEHPVPVVVSGASAKALDAGLGRLAGLVESDGGLSVGEVGWSAAHRSVFEHRAVVVASGREELLEGLKAPVVSGVAGSVGRSVLVFPGQGTQWAGMGAELLESSPVFAARMGECAAALGRFVEWDLLEVVRSGEGLERVDVVQPVTWAVMVSLAEVWAACGVRPDAVVGHSQGEIAAAVVSGAVSLEDGARVVALRSQVIGRVLAGAGGMASVALPAGVVEERLSGWSDRLGVAAVNGPAITVVSGDADAVGEFLEACEQDGIRARRIAVDYASHSAQVEAVEAELATLLAPVVAREPEIPFYSTVEPGQRVRTDAGYWYRNLRRRVHFAETVGVLLADGFGVFIEASAHPVLTIGIQELADQTSTGRDVVVTGTLRKGEGGLHRLWTSMAEAFVQGVPVDWKAAYTAHGLSARRVDLPTYPFQRRHYWAETSPAGVGDVAAARFGMTWQEHPFLGGAFRPAGSGEVLLAGRLSLATHAWMTDHAVSGTTLLPGTAFVELALQAGSVAGCPMVEELELRAPLVLPERGGVQLQVRVADADESGRRRVSLHAQPDELAVSGAGGLGTDAGEAPWTLHAVGVLAPVSVRRPEEDSGPAPDTWAGAAWPPAGAVPVEPTALYERFAELGYEYGEVFGGLRSLWRRDDEVFAEVRLPGRVVADAPRYAVHPALLDAALQPWMAGGLFEVPDDSLLLPFVWRGMTVHAPGADTVRVRLARDDDGALSCQAVDPSGAPVFSLDALAMRPVERDRLAAALGASAAAVPLYQVAWRAVRARPAGRPVRWALIGGDRLRARLPHGGEAEAAGFTAYAGLDDLRRDLDAAGVTPEAVVVALGPHRLPDDLPGRSVDVEVREVLRQGLALVQGWLADERLADVRLVVLTERAVAAGPDEDVHALTSSGLWGLLRSAQSEHPGRFGLVDVDDHDASVAAIPVALREIAEGTPQLAVREGTLYAPALVRTQAPAGDPDSLAAVRDPAAVRAPSAVRDSAAVRAPSAVSDPVPAAVRAPGDPGPAADAPRLGDGTVVVTGATGTLGRLFARHLVQRHGVRHLLLLSRSGAAAPGGDELMAELREQGAEPELVACDAADRDALRSVLAGIPGSRPLTGVVHAAGVLDDGAIEALDPGRIDSVLRSKADAALHLHELTADRRLAAFVLFSGAAGLLGRPGQANYAAANTFVDALAHRRRAQGLPALSLAWGLWGEATGMTGHLAERDLRRMRRSGIAPMPDEQGLALFDRALALASDHALLVPMRLDRAALARERAVNGPEAVPVLLRALLPAAAAQRTAAHAAAARDDASATEDDRASAAVMPGELAERLAALDGPARGRELLKLVRTRVAKVLGYPGPAAVEPGRPFRDAGFDSLMSVELRNQLSAATGLRFPATIVFDHPTPRAVAEHIGAELGLDGGGEDAADAALSSLEALLTAVADMEADDSRRAVVRRRLEAALVAVGAAGTAPDAADGRSRPGEDPTGTRAAVEERLDSASDDDLFAFIEEQL